MQPGFGPRDVRLTSPIPINFKLSLGKFEDRRACKLCLACEKLHPWDWIRSMGWCSRVECSSTNAEIHRQLLWWVSVNFWRRVRQEDHMCMLMWCFDKNIPVLLHQCWAIVWCGFLLLVVICAVRMPNRSRAHNYIINFSTRKILRVLFCSEWQPLLACFW